MRFAYKAQQADGRPLQGELDALDTQDAARQLARRGVIPLSIARLGESAAARRGAVSPRALTTLLAELALTLRSGVPFDQALQLAATGLPSRTRALIETIRKDVMAGESVAQAFERQRPEIPVDLVAMTRVGEASGHLDVVFASVAKERERAQRLAEKVRSAVSYPAFLLVSAIAVLLFFLLHVVPQFANVFDGSAGDPGSLVLILLSLSTWLSNRELQLVAVVVTSAAALPLLARNQTIRAAGARLSLRTPLIGRIIKGWRTSRFLASLSLLLGQGVGADEALKILRDAIGAEGREPLAHAYDEVRRGARLSEALMRTKLFDDFVARVLRIGEETGELPKIVSDAAVLYAHNLERRLDVLTSVIGPAAILLIALLIGGVMAIIMSALMSVDQAAF